MKVTGNCHCGKIAYSAVVDPAQAGACHCTDCQTLSGSPYRTSIPAPAATFQLHSGAPRIYIKTADSGAQRAHAFCPDCGSPVYSAAVHAPRTYSLRVGCLAQRAVLPPRRQIWCLSAVQWSMNLEDVPRIERQ